MSAKLWLWKNFVDGRPEYWAFDNPYPCHPNGDQITLGEPCGYAVLKDSTPGRTDVSEAEVIAAVKRAQASRTEERSSPRLSVSDEEVDALALHLCASENEHPEGTQNRFLNDGLHSITFKEIAKRRVRVIVNALVERSYMNRERS